MFTGIIQQLGRVTSIEDTSFGAILRIDPGNWAHRPSPGDSIAVNGCCLTSTADSGDFLRFDVITQTLQVTTLGSLQENDPVNLEHAVTPQTLLGGHIVQGHIDGIGRVILLQDETEEYRIRLMPEPELMDYIVEKGSIAIDGTSMTVAKLGPDWFEIALIPTTLQMTTLGSLTEGSKVNLETDYLAKTVVNWLRRTKPQSTVV